jgi:hypothetical protein
MLKRRFNFVCRSLRKQLKREALCLVLISRVCLLKSRQFFFVPTVDKGLIQEPYALPSFTPVVANVPPPVFHLFISSLMITRMGRTS